VEWYIGISITGEERFIPKTGAASSSEMLAPVYQITEHNIPEDHNLHNACLPKAFCQHCLSHHVYINQPPISEHLKTAILHHKHQLLNDANTLPAMSPPPQPHNKEANGKMCRSSPIHTTKDQRKLK
jgi:hypothetical protein